MTLLVRVQREPRIVNGELVKINETCRIPADLATVLCQKGYAVLADGNDHIKDAKARKAKKEAAKEAAKEEKAKKRGRPPKDSD